MSDFYYRTEDIRPDEVLNFFVEISGDRDIVNKLKQRTPSILVGSRGTGKSFLMRVAEAELNRDFEDLRILPVYTTFASSALIRTGDPDQFAHWMISRLAADFIRAVSKCFGKSNDDILKLIHADKKGFSSLEETAVYYENSWLRSDKNTAVVPFNIAIESFKNAVEDICVAFNLQRISFFIDEAAHVLLREQQQQFFTMFRDLRSAFITCNAAVYPGVTHYGDVFQKKHDSDMIYIARSILEKNYIDSMREVIEKQADSATLTLMAKHDSNFRLLAFAASGNPRILLKTLNLAIGLRNADINSVFREFYRNDFWSEHSQLADKYPPYEEFIKWGRDFIEYDVLPKLKERNEESIEKGKEATSYLWIDDSAHKSVKQSLELLAYTGIIIESGTGLRGTRNAIGSRYLVNVGMCISRFGNPIAQGSALIRLITQKRFVEYGAATPKFESLAMRINDAIFDRNLPRLNEQLKSSIDFLDITNWQKKKLKELNLLTLEDVLKSTNTQLQEAYYVGQVRSRQMKNAAHAAIYEYLSG